MPSRWRQIGLIGLFVIASVGCGDSTVEGELRDAGVIDSDGGAGLDGGLATDMGTGAGPDMGPSCTLYRDRLEVDIPAFTVTGTLTLDGVPAASTLTNRGRIVLEGIDGRDRVVVTDTRRSSFQIQVVPGRYRLLYELANGGTTVPRNKRHVLREEVEIRADRRLDVDLVTTRLSARATIGGAESTSLFNNADLVLVDAQGDEAHVLNTRDVEGSVMVLRGDYALEWRLAAGGTTIPATPRRTLREDISLQRADERIEVDVPVRRWVGRLTRNGVEAPTGVVDRGGVFLAGPTAEQDRVIAETTDLDFDVLVIPGSFDVLYRRLGGGISVPRNERRVLERVTVPPGTQTFSRDLDIPSVSIEADFTLNGRTPDLGVFADAEVRLVDPDHPSPPILLGELRDGSGRATVLPGAYELRYFANGPNTQTPVNENGLLRAAARYDKDVTLDVDVPSVEVQVDVTVDGGPPPTSLQGEVAIVLFEPLSGTTASLGAATGPALQALILPGSYEVRAVPIGPVPPGWPVHTAGLVRTWTVSEDVALAFDVRTVRLRGGATLNGLPAPDTTGPRPILGLEAELDLALLGPPAQFDARVLPGTYELVYGSEEGIEGFPGNERARLGCLEIP